MRKLVCKVGEKLKFRLVEAVTSGLSTPSGQTALKTMMTTAVNNDLFTELNADDYCVHHLNGDHSDYSPGNLAITTKVNHSRITSLTTWGNWVELKNALSECFVIKAHTQKLLPKEIDRIVNSIKRDRKIYVDKNNVKWVLTPDAATKYSIAPIDYRAAKKYPEMNFDSDEELNSYMKTNKWRRLA